MKGIPLHLYTFNIITLQYTVQRYTVTWYTLQNGLLKW